VARRLNWPRVLVIILLISIVVSGSLLIRAGCQPGPSLEINLPQDSEFDGDILIDGAVTNPGYYPFTDSDSIETLTQAAGGATGNADLTALELYVPEEGAGAGPQKVDINRAEAWLLDALPNIGPSRAQAIIDYREENGPFRSIDEITNVDGIGTATYEQIKDLITVSEQ
jgi:competence protein ComEA